MEQSSRCLCAVNQELLDGEVYYGPNASFPLVLSNSVRQVPCYLEPVLSVPVPPFCHLPVSVSVRVPIAVKRQHDHSKSDKGKALTGMAYIFKCLVHYHHGVTWWHAGRHGAGEVAKCPTSCLAGSRKWSVSLEGP